MADLNAFEVNILDGRNRFGFIPLRDYAIYVDEVVDMNVSVAVAR